MKNISKFLFLFPLVGITGCADHFTQPAAKVEYHLENYYGYGDVQGPPTKNSPDAIAVRQKGAPVIMEDASKDKDYQPPETIKEEQVRPVSVASKGEQVYTVSDKIGPESNSEGLRVVRNPVLTDPQTVNVSSKVHTVARGETLFSISRTYGVPILPIIVVNGLEAPYSLNAGQQIKIPEGKFHTVKDGETLYSISRQYGVDMSGIVKLNNLKSPYNVSTGERLQIPFPSDLPNEEITSEREATVEKQPELSEPQAAPISRSSKDDGKPASLRNPTGGILGEIVTDKDGNIISTSQKKSVVQEAETKSKFIDTEEENQKLAVKTNDTIQSMGTKSNGEFMWPIQGKIIKKFGPNGSEYNDGINISASSGAAVKASQNGRVVYTGNSLKSYGNLVIVKHDNGLLSAYAHLNNVNVKKDQEVSKGQIIGTVGSTGKVTSPQLYFAIRKGKEAKNPLNYLK